MDFDELVLLQRDKDRYAWNEKGARATSAVCNLASQFKDKQPYQVVGLFCGSFNFCFKVLFPDDGVRWMVRFPIPGKAMFPEEKLQSEVAALRFMKATTKIPVPTVVAFGTAEEDTTGLGPFIITDFIEGKPLSDVLGQPLGNGHKILRPDIEDETLKIVYRQIADIMLELWKHDFDLIGALSLDTDNSWSIKSRPLTLKMNEIARCGDVTVGHPEPFSTTEEYFLELANQNILHLERQRNSISDETDAQTKYISRRLFLSATRCLTSPLHNSGPFKLFCDDFNPGNILVDDSLTITGIIDLEFTYAAPIQFLSAPWRSLLLLEPSVWNSNHVELFHSKLDLFLGVLREQEANYPNPISLSALMQQSAVDMTFWYGEAARDSFSFEDIYWSRLDKFFFKNSEDRNAFISQQHIRDGSAEFARSKIGQLHQYLEVKAEHEQDKSVIPPPSRTTKSMSFLAGFIFLFSVLIFLLH
ncbi:MAG: hypothetical protein M1840_006338 [Geoglossum simile]|nr:MAG: hypothetical protein M1840_006338 [Geoglossum simile]